MRSLFSMIANLVYTVVQQHCRWSKRQTSMALLGFHRVV